jgi:hypothetical protein
VATSRGHDDFHKSIVIYRAIASTSMLCCAGFYILGGLFCFSMLKEVGGLRWGLLGLVLGPLGLLGAAGGWSCGSGRRCCMPPVRLQHSAA